MKATHGLFFLATLFAGIVAPAQNVADKTGGDPGFPISLKTAIVPREEMRQQILQGIKEYRYTYSFGNVPYSSCFFAEFYADGKFTRRLLLTSSMAWKKSEYGGGTLSLGWNFLTHELMMINDNGFALWNSRQVIPSDLFNRPTEVICAENPKPEMRDPPPNHIPAPFAVYPVLGVIDGSNLRMKLPPFP